MWDSTLIAVSSPMLPIFLNFHTKIIQYDLAGDAKVGGQAEH